MVFRNQLLVFVGAFYFALPSLAHLRPDLEGHPQLSRTEAKTVGEPWPKPQDIRISPERLAIDAENFIFKVIDQDCDIIQQALKRYYDRIFPNEKAGYVKYSSRKVKESPVEQLMVHLNNPCEKFPSLESDESYMLQVNAGESALNAKSVWGILRGLETFSQLVYEDAEGTYFINATDVQDAPRFGHRGIMLDSSRHFLHTRHIKQNLDAMEHNKMNVFHWHLVDDQSFPYQSPAFPELSNKGAYNPNTHVYTTDDMREIVEYARVRGIRVVAEFDTPGHTQSWGKGHRELLTPCYKNGKLDGTYGPLNPILNSTYTFLQTFFKEAVNFFPDAYIHLGGDEVSFNCWQSNPDITHFMAQQGFGKDYSKLEQYYVQRLLDMVKGLGARYIIWQEPVDNGVKVAADTVVEVWKGGWQAELAKVTSLGLKALISSPWYLNYISYGEDWDKYYYTDPLGFTGTAQQKALVMGGEACIWGEYVDGTNLISRLWPRASAVAERLWSPATVNSTTEAGPRLNEHRCRMLRRGLPVEPVNGPGFCKYEM